MAVAIHQIFPRASMETGSMPPQRRPAMRYFQLPLSWYPNTTHHNGGFKKYKMLRAKEIAQLIKCVLHRLEDPEPT